MINLAKRQQNAPCNCLTLSSEIRLLRDEISALKKQIAADKYKEQEALERVFKRSRALYDNLKFSWEK